jgi:hypothetical protein
LDIYRVDVAPSSFQFPEGASVSEAALPDGQLLIHGPGREEQRDWAQQPGAQTSPTVGRAKDQATQAERPKEGDEDAATAKNNAIP